MRFVVWFVRYVGWSKRKWVKICVVCVMMFGVRSIVVMKRRLRCVDKLRRCSVVWIVKFRSFRKKKSNGWLRSVNKGE